MESFLVPIETDIWVTLDQLVPFDRNPRKTRNPRYEAIKTSIRNTGLKNKFRVTRRNPDDEIFMIYDGGNTRLEILWELWRETGDERFYRINVDIVPWQGEIASLAGHMSENENRGSTLFIEKALAAAELRKLFEEESGGIRITGRELARRITESGWTLKPQNLGNYEYATRSLLPCIPDALWGGMGHGKVIEIRKLENKSREFWLGQDTGKSIPDQFYTVWRTVLKEHDDPDFNITLMRRQMDKAIGEVLQIHDESVTLEINTMLRFPDEKPENLDSGGRSVGPFAVRVIESDDPVNTTQDQMPHDAITVTDDPAKPNQLDPSCVSARGDTKGASERGGGSFRDLTTESNEVKASLPELRQQCFDQAKSLMKMTGLAGLIGPNDFGFGYVVDTLSEEHPPLSKSPEILGMVMHLLRLSIAGFSFHGVEAGFEMDELSGAWQLLPDLERLFGDDKAVMLFNDFCWTRILMQADDALNHEELELRRKKRRLEELCAQTAIAIKLEQGEV